MLHPWRCWRSGWMSPGHPKWADNHALSTKIGTRWSLMLLLTKEKINVDIRFLNYISLYFFFFFSIWSRLSLITVLYLLTSFLFLSFSLFLSLVSPFVQARQWTAEWRKVSVSFGNCDQEVLKTSYFSFCVNSFKIRFFWQLLRLF